MLNLVIRLLSYFTKGKANRQETISNYGIVIGEENIPKM
jgi:hypothetical protein